MHPLQSVVSNCGPFQRPEFEPDAKLLEKIKEDVRILVLGAGGLGCELLKNLVCMSFVNIDVIDMDTIDLSNLNRQFLFTRADIGQPKATTAASAVNRRFKGCNVRGIVGRIEDFDETFYQSYNAIACGLDSVYARRWINNMLASLVEYDETGNVIPESVIPFVDGGTEGFLGMARVILFSKTPCIECQLDLFPPPLNFPLCTIANTPRLPEHCIEFARVILWEKENPFGLNCALNGDDMDHIQWIYDKARARADEFSISGVTLRLTKGVVKRIIPAVASTNAVIASACSLELFKVISFCYPYLNNYMTFSNTEAVHMYTFQDEIKKQCLACGRVPISICFPEDATLKVVIDFLMESPKYRMKNPSITTERDGAPFTLYMNFPGFEELCSKHLQSTLTDLGLRNGQILTVADITLSKTAHFVLKFAD